MSGPGVLGVTLTVAEAAGLAAVVGGVLGVQPASTLTTTAAVAVNLIRRPLPRCRLTAVCVVVTTHPL